jgi:DNA ligase (NAD+)
MNIEDFGSITAYAVYDYFDNEDNMNQVRELLSIVRIKQEEKKDVDFKSLEGLAFVVTGSVETFKNRKELEDLITSLNGKLNGSVSAKTNFLINNDTTSTTGKNQKAKDLGVKIISENEFNIMIGRS